MAGEKLVIDCSVSYNNIIIDMKWDYPAQLCVTTPSDSCEVPGTRITTSTPLKISTLVSSTLTVDPLYESDTGIYTCSYQPHSQPLYKQPVSIDITVYPRPFVIGNSEDSPVSVMVGTEAILEIQLQALPAPTVRWTFNSQVLLEDEAKYSMANFAPIEDGREHNIELLIKDITVEDNGEYELTASVQGATFSKKYTLEVQEQPTIQMKYEYKDIPVTLGMRKKTVFFQPANEIDVECKARTGTPAPSINWYWQACNLPDCLLTEASNTWTLIPNTLRTPSEDRINSPYFTSGTTSLRITSNKSGWIRCVAKNSAGSADSNIQMVVSALPESARGIGFTEQTMTEGRNLVENNNITLDCLVIRFLCPDGKFAITGTGTNMYTQNTSGVLFKMENDSYRLRVPLIDVSADQSGDTYECRCIEGRQGETLTLTVNEYVASSWIKSVGQGTTANTTIGGTQSYICQPTGTPLPTVSWYKDGEPLATTNTVFLSRDNYNLTIEKAGVENAGEYKCVASTPRRNITGDFTLTVTAPPPGLNTGQIVMIVVIVIVVIALAIILSVCIVRKYCRKKYIPHSLLLPSKEMINPDIPLDEQTDALPYDIGWEFPFGSLKMGMLLGQGAFGRVLKAEAMNIEEGVASTTVAVKAVRDTSDIDQVKALISELKILIHIGQHLNIVNLLGACTKDISKGHILVIVEYCRYGNLRSYLLKHKANFNPTMDVDVTDNTAGVKLGHVSVDMEDEDYLGGTSELHSATNPVSLKDLMSWSYQIARGMEYLASIDYIHRDLAARNVLLAEDNIVKICDFGLAKDIYKYQEYQKQTDGPLPIKWMALESLTHKVFNVRTDIWAYGVTVWELFSLAATPYPGWDIDDTFIDKLQDGFRMEIPKHCSQQTYENVMLTCWHPDPEKRPNFAELAEMMGEFVDVAIKNKLVLLEDPYLTSRDSRTDIKIRPSSVRKREALDLDSAYLPTKSLQKPNGAKPKQQYNNYYNTSPSGSGSQPSGKKPWKREKGTSEEKLPLHVEISDEENAEPDMPNVAAPSPSPWERQSHLGKLSVNIQGEDSHSHHSVDSDGSVARPPSYNYVMEKSAPKAKATNNLASSAGRYDVATGGSTDSMDHPKSTKSYIETTC